MSNLTANKLIERYVDLAKRRGNLLTKITQSIHDLNNELTLAASDGHDPASPLRQKESLLMQAHSFWSKGNEASRKAPDILRKNPITVSDLEHAEQLMDEAKQHLIDAASKLNEADGLPVSETPASPKKNEKPAQVADAVPDAPKAKPEPAPQTQVQPVSEPAPADPAPAPDASPSHEDGADAQHHDYFGLPHEYVEVIQEFTPDELRASFKVGRVVNKGANFAKGKQTGFGFRNKDKTPHAHQGEHPVFADDEHPSK